MSMCLSEGHVIDIDCSKIDMISMGRAEHFDTHSIA